MNCEHSSSRGKSSPEDDMVLLVFCFSVVFFVLLFFVFFCYLLFCCCFLFVAVFFVILSPDMPAGVVVENLVKLYVELQGCRNDQVELFHFSRPMRQVVSDNNFEGM